MSEACDKCGAELVEVDCSACAGKGYFEHDCGEDTCCCADDSDEDCLFCDGLRTCLVCYPCDQILKHSEVLRK